MLPVHRLAILKKSWRYSISLSIAPGAMLSGLVLPFLKYSSAVWCSAADTHLKLLDRAVSGARFFSGVVFEWDIVHRGSVAVLCSCITSGVTQCTRFMVLYLDRICQCGLHAVPWSHICTLMGRLAAEPRNTARLLFSQYPSTWNDIADLVFDGGGVAGFKSSTNAFLLS